MPRMQKVFRKFGLERDEWRDMLIAATRASGTLALSFEKESRIASLLFADDIVLTGRNWADLAAMLAVCDEHARRNRYRFGAAKCEVLVPPQSRLDSMPPLRLAGQELQTTDTFIYLGVP
ncbi:hypothetical protein THASP1DRAFT_23455, partial [Thamnocephalis sphaerospora]